MAGSAAVRRDEHSVVTVSSVRRAVVDLDEKGLRQKRLAIQFWSEGDVEGYPSRFPCQPGPQMSDDLAKAKRPKHWWWAIGVGLLLVVWWWAQSQRVPPDMPPPSISQANKLISDLAAQHEAETKWARSLSTHSPYSLEIERALTRQDRKPILFIGSVIDVRRRDGEIIVEMEAEPDEKIPFLRFSLRCSPNLTERLLTELQRDARYIAVVTVDSVSKARFRIDAHGQAIGEDEVETELEITAADYFVAQGQCVALQRYP